MPYARPLSSRILSWLPGPPRARIAAWATVPWLNAGVNLVLGADGTSAVWDQSGVLVVLNYAALSFAVAITLWGTDHIAKRCATLQAATPGADARPLFRGMDNMVGPLTVSLAGAVIFGASALVRDGWGAASVRGLTWFVIGIALWTFLWTYVSLQLGLNRLGRHRLVRHAVTADPGLGLQPLGRLASTSLWLLLVWLVPVLLTALPDVLGAGVGLSVLAAALAAFFFSLSGLHRQMVLVKDEALALARGLYAEAYEPVDRARTLDSLARQRDLLTAADALEKRASAIHEWPIDEGTLARVITITTSVIAMTIGRLILDPFGL